MARIPPSPDGVMPAPLPPSAGIGLKPEHYSEVLGEGGNATASARPGWLEIHPQNYFVEGGPSLRWLEAIAAQYQLSFHSTGLSLGSAQGPSARDLDWLARLAERFQPASISDHLSWSATGDEQFPDLLPMPYTGEALKRMADNVDQVQERLGRAILVENPSRYLAFAGDELDEADFLHALCAHTGCGILYDINNVVVSANNLGLDAATMVDAINPDLIGEVHLAGHALEDHGDFTLAIDDHGSVVGQEAWLLFARFIARAGARPTLIEWDSAVPEYAVLLGESAKAQAVIDRLGANNARAA